MTLPTSENQQQEIFRILVEAQDSGSSVKQSRQKVATDFSLDLDDVVKLERMGITAKWPPLDGHVATGTIQAEAS